MKILLLATSFAVFAAGAPTFTNVSVSNSSTAGFTDTTGGTQVEFQSGALSTNVDNSGPIPILQNRFGWYFGQRMSNPAADGTRSVTLSYELFFTIDDPLNSGYFFFITSDSRGWATALYEQGTGALQIQLDTLEAQFSRNGVYQSEPGLNIPGVSGLAGGNQLDLNGHGLGGGFFASALESGTLSFSVRLTAQMSLSYLAGDSGEAGIRYGLAPTLPGLTATGTPGADGDPASALGSFMTVELVPLTGPVAAVPEPATWLTSGIPFAVLLLLRRFSKQTANTASPNTKS